MKPQYIPEINTLIAMVKYLHSEGWLIESLAMPHGQKIDTVGNRNKLKAELVALGIQENSIKFASKGEDVRARKGDILWRIECKGLGDDVRPATIRNNFDRALASTVSYYSQNQGLQIGLALPEEYYQYVLNRAPQALRVALNLWVLLYVSADDEVIAFTPNKKLSS